MTLTGWQEELIRTGIHRSYVRMADVEYIHKEFGIPKAEILDWLLGPGARLFTFTVDAGEHKNAEEAKAAMTAAYKESRDAKKLAYAAADLDPNMLTTLQVHWEYTPPRRSGVFALLSRVFGPVFKALSPLGTWAKSHACPLSLLFSLIVLTDWWGLGFAVGFLLMLGFHEMGHKWAANMVGIKTGEPFFWPGLGAVISMKEPPKSAFDEAILGIGGPVAGTAISFWAFGMGLLGIGNPQYWYTLGMVSVTINLFNLLPMRPLDGGRVVGVLSHWVTIPGLVAGGYFLVRPIFDGEWPEPIWILLMFIGVVEFFHARKKAKTTDYLSRTPMRHRLYMGLAYAGLVAVLGTTLFLGFDHLNSMKNVRDLTFRKPAGVVATVIEEPDCCSCTECNWEPTEDECPEGDDDLESDFLCEDEGPVL